MCYYRKFFGNVTLREYLWVSPIIYIKNINYIFTTLKLVIQNYLRVLAFAPNGVRENSPNYECKISGRIIKEESMKRTIKQFLKIDAWKLEMNKKWFIQRLEREKKKQKKNYNDDD